jgi:CubicO group peptidase (beta-lactamase class C family)
MEDGSEQWQNNLFYHEVKGCPAGGGFSTVEDLLNFDIALRSGSLINSETWEMLTTERTGPPEGHERWGYGFLIKKHDKLGRIVGHGGGWFGISSTLDMYLDTGYTVAIMSNFGGGVEAISDKIQSVLQSLLND